MLANWVMLVLFYAWVPFVALPYSSKVAGFLEDLEIAMPPLKQVNAGQLIAYIDRWWDLRRNLQARLEKTNAV